MEMAHSESQFDHALRGAARLMDVGGRLGYGVGAWYELYRDLDLSPATADTLALCEDWAAVGLDLRAAMATVDRLVETVRRELERELGDSAASEKLLEQAARKAVNECLAARCGSPAATGNEAQMNLFNKTAGAASQSG